MRLIPEDFFTRASLGLVPNLWGRARSDITPIPGDYDFLTNNGLDFVSDFVIIDILIESRA